MKRAIIVSALVAWTVNADAQSISQRGFIEGRAFAFPQAAPNDTVRHVEDLLAREEVFVKPAGWIQFAAGFDLRANSHDQVGDEWRLDVWDRAVRRPRLALRRLSATIAARHFTLDIGKQFIRWGRADIINPTDRFAPRDYLNVVDSEVLPVLGVHPSVQIGKETFEAVWLPRMTPSRVPLFDQRWTVFPSGAAGVAVVDGGSRIPDGSQQGARWSHVGDRFESALSYFDGFNHLPNIDAQVLVSPSAIELIRVYPDVRTYGVDIAIPTRVFTLKGEAAYFTSPSSTSDEYVLYVVEVERQSGEWLFDGGYAGEVVRSSRASFPFAPDRGTARSIIGRAAYTVDPRREIAIEGAVRQSGHGFYVKGDYSQAFGQHWRMTLAAVGLAGEEDDFLGQFHRNSHGSIALRFSF
jgi:hypothetical protein